MNNWRAITGYENYMINPSGVVRNVTRENRRLKVYIDKDNNQYYNLCKNGKVRKMLVQYLLEITFPPKGTNYKFIEFEN